MSSLELSLLFTMLLQILIIIINKRLQFNFINLCGNKQEHEQTAQKVLN